MLNGFMGKILWVDLEKQELRDEPLDEKLARDFLGGYGLGARILFSRQKAGVDPLGPEAILGMMTGVLTGTDALGGSRYIMVGKSPLTGGWGDANSGGNVGPYLRFAGYDAVFFTGISEKPVYLYINNGKAELKDAAALWGKDSYETEDVLRGLYGKDLEVACIGPAGEKLSLIAAVMNNKGRAAARSGLGAVMGAKKIKAIAVQGSMKVPVADADALKAMRSGHVAALSGPATPLRDFGTSCFLNMTCEDDDAPAKNWAGTALVDMPTYPNIGGEKVVEHQQRRYGCYRCPIACGGIMKDNSGTFKWGDHAHKPEYETIAMYGTNLLNDNVEAVIKANDVCNHYGLDTISAGSCIGFTIECYENGLITKEDTGGLEMTWGNAEAIIAMTEMMGRREGFGDIIADGVKKAAERIGKGSEQYAMHSGGQEFPAHDPRCKPSFAIAYGTDATPGRHTQEGEMQPAGFLDEAFPPPFEVKGRGALNAIARNFNHAMNAAGCCMFVYSSIPESGHFMDQLNAITGWNLTREDLQEIGERACVMRQAFNAREGLGLPWKFPDRMMGIPPKTVGPRAGVTIDPAAYFDEYLDVMELDKKTGRPGKAKLMKLDLKDVADELYP